MGIFDKYASALERLDPIKYTGIVDKVQGLLIEARGPRAVVGELCQILLPDGKRHRSGPRWWACGAPPCSSCPTTRWRASRSAARVIAMGEQLSVPVSDRLLGRVLDSMGKPIDGKGDVGSALWYPVFRAPPDVLARAAHPTRRSPRASAPSTACSPWARASAWASSPAAASASPPCWA